MNMFAATLVLVLTCLEALVSSCPGVDQCKCVQTLPISLSAAVKEQPYYGRFMDDTPSNRRIDGICYTFAKVAGNDGIYQNDLAIKYCDGSTQILSYYVSQLTAGSYRVANTTCLINDFNLGFPGCNTYMLYRCYLCGDCADNAQCETPTFIASNSYTTPITSKCLTNAQQLAISNGLLPPQYFVFPYRYPVDYCHTPCLTHV